MVAACAVGCRALSRSGVQGLPRLRDGVASQAVPHAPSHINIADERNRRGQREVSVHLGSNVKCCDCRAKAT